MPKLAAMQKMGKELRNGAKPMESMMNITRRELMGMRKRRNTK